MNGIKSDDFVLVTGGTGSLGLALGARLNGKCRVRILSRDEKKQYDMKKLFPEFDYMLGDISHDETAYSAVRDATVIIHGASLKYVNISEQQPMEYVRVNVGGTYALLEHAIRSPTLRVCVGISTDKASQPLNCYGMTKALLEKMFFQANELAGGARFVVARYGNVMGTRGSVIPFWQECGKHGTPLPLTDGDMTRFFFSLDEAVDLVAAAMDIEGGLMVTKKMSSAPLGVAAEIMASAWGVQVEKVGRRPGEKKHEDLLSAHELGMCEPLTDAYLLFDPQLYDRAPKEPGYSSNNAPRLTRADLKKLFQPFMPVN